MYDTEHHYGFCLLSSVLECFPGKALDHASDAAGVAIVSCHNLAALFWTASTLLMLSVVCGSHTVAVYST